MDDKVHLIATKQVVTCGEPRVKGILTSGDLQHVTCEACQQVAAGTVQASEVTEEEEQNNG